MFPKNMGIRTNSAEEARMVLAFYEEEGYTHDSMETNEHFAEYPILILDEYDTSDITGCKEAYYQIADGTLGVIDFGTWFAENIGDDFESASEADMLVMLGVG